MQASPPERLLTTTALSTFESLALLFAEPAAGGLDSLGPGAVGARVAFAGRARGGAVDGALAVRVSAGVAAALAENMLGVAAAAPGEQRDAVGEFANVVCGHVLSLAGGPEAVFRLAAPDHAAGGTHPEAAWRTWLDVEGGRACVTLEAPDVLFAPEAAGAGGPP